MDPGPGSYTELCAPSHARSMSSSRSPLVKPSEELKTVWEFMVLRNPGAGGQLRTWKAPACDDVCSSLRLLCFDVDTPLSMRGERQLKDVQAQLSDCSFLQKADPQLIVFSPRRRAVRTREVLFGSEVPSKAMPQLVERTPMEGLCPAQFAERVQGFKDWLAKTPETRIVVVGHCQFFARLLGKGAGYDRYLSNAEVKRCYFDPTSGAFDIPISMFVPQESDSSGEDA
eukprot:s750_g12.t1